MEQLILIADDDPALVTLVQAVVQGEGYSSITARDGKQAYNFLKSGAEFVAAIVDINMPYIDGNDLVNFMQSDVRFSDIPVLIMTGDRDPRSSAKAIASGAVGFLPKPFTNDQLRTAVKTLTQTRKR